MIKPLTALAAAAVMTSCFSAELSKKSFIGKDPASWTKEDVQSVLDQENISIFIDRFKTFWDPLECNADHYFVFEINDDWMVRIPKTEEAGILREKEIIDLLKDVVSISMPDYSIIGEKTELGVYKKIPGVSFSKEAYSNLTSDQKMQVAEDLATFFHELHRLYSIVDLERLEIVDETTQVLSGVHQRVPDPRETQKILQEVLPDHLFGKLREIVFTKYYQIYQDQKFKALIHNDVHEGNIIFDPEEQKVNGIIDFEDLAIGDIRREFRFLYFISPELMINTVKAYADKASLDEEQLLDDVLVVLIYREFTNVKKIFVTPKAASKDDFRVLHRLEEFVKTEHGKKLLGS